MYPGRPACNAITRLLSPSVYLRAGETAISECGKLSAKSNHRANVRQAEFRQFHVVLVET